MADLNERVAELHELVLTQGAEIAALRQTVRHLENSRALESRPVDSAADADKLDRIVDSLEEVIAVVKGQEDEVAALKQTMQRFLDPDTDGSEQEETNNSGTQAENNSSDAAQVTRPQQEYEDSATLMNNIADALHAAMSARRASVLREGIGPLSSQVRITTNTNISDQHEFVQGSSRDAEVHRSVLSDLETDRACSEPATVVKKMSASPAVLLDWADDAAKAESEDVIQSPPPRKKPRMIVEVVIPVRNHALGMSSQGKGKGKACSPNIATLKSEVKQEVKLEIGKDILSEAAVLERLRPIGLKAFPVTLDADVRSVTVSREFMSQIFGGSSFLLRPPVIPRHEKGYKDFLYPTLEMNPHLPREPGQPGLLCRVTRAARGERWPAVSKVLVRWGSNRYQYMGDYRMFLAHKPLSPQEFAAMPEKMKTGLAATVAKRLEDRDVRFRLKFIREHCREPTMEEVELALSGKDKFSFSTRDILVAFEAGEIVVALWCMKCVAYDEEFQRELAQKYPEFLRGKAQASLKGKRKEEAGPSTARQGRISSKRKRHVGLDVDASGSDVYGLEETL